ncbi:hypothetical protein [Pseudomonas sp. GZD-222]|uniref:hypothetical protein n=1 Tax=Pseudomonas sp. GZD-222 TaxID=3404805 RepID=UPI003BB657E2
MKFLIYFGMALTIAQLVGCGEKVEAQPEALAAPSKCECAVPPTLYASKASVFNCTCGSMQCVVAFPANGNGAPLDGVAMQCK